MSTFFARGAPSARINPDDMRAALQAAIDHAPDVSRTLALPPDASRAHSGAGTLTRMLFDQVGERGTFHVMPALGTHFPMTDRDLRRMFGERIPRNAFKEHRWRDELVRLGEVPADYVHEVSEGALEQEMPDYPIPVEISRRVARGDYGAVFSIGQVVPHEVVGMANGVKNVLVGTGGQETIHKTHFLGAAYGMERIMGRAETPVRDVLNYGHRRYLTHPGIIYILTVIGQEEDGTPVMRGIYVGDDHQTFLQAARLSRQVNVTLLKEPPRQVVAYLDPEEFHSTWLGNKGIYRTRMAIADGGTLTIIAPAVRTFGEDPEIDRLIRRHGYRGTTATFEAVRRDEELRGNLSAAAHLIHGSSEGRFRIVYATDPALLSRQEIEGVGFDWMDVSEALALYRPDQIPEGRHGDCYFVRRPALGLWAVQEKFAAPPDRQGNSGGGA